MSLRPLAVFACIGSLAAPARAAELIPGWDSRVVWDSNVFRSPTDEQDDFALRTGPDLRFRRVRGDLRWDWIYRGRWEGYATIDNINAMDHFLNGTFDARLTPRLEVSVRNDLALTETTVADPVDTLVGAPSELLLGRQQIFTNARSAALAYQLSPTTTAELTLQQDVVRYERPEQLDNNQNRASLQLTRALSPRHVVGAGGAVSLLDFQSTDERPARDSTFVELFGIWNFRISPRFEANLSFGPAWSRPEEGDDTDVLAVIDRNGNLEPPEDAQEEDVSLTVFGRGSLIRRWNDVTATLSYQRRASAAAGIGGASTLDSVTGVLNWRPDRRWYVTAVAGWSRESSSDDSVQPLPGGVLGLERSFETSVNTIRLDLTASRQLSRRLSVVGAVRWWSQRAQQESESFSFVNDTDLDTRNVRFELGFTYELAPVRL